MYPVLTLNKSLGSMYSIDISRRFLNLFPKDCPLSNFQISKVLSGNEEVKNYENKLIVTSKGIFMI